MASVIRGSGESTLGGALDVQGVLTYEDVTSVDSVGIITARSGAHVGTGASIFSPDTNELALGTNNVERLRIVSGGLVGIGTITPSVVDGNGLHIAGSSAGIKLQNLNNSDWAYIEYADELNTTKYIQGYRDASGLYAIRPGTSLNATPGISLDSSGNIGIDKTAPADRLHVGGKIRFGNNNTYYGVIEHEEGVTGANIYTSADSGGHIFKKSTTTQMIINGSGLVGIGTNLQAASSNTKLTLHEAGSTACRLVITNSGSSAAESVQLYSQNDELVVYADGVDVARFSTEYGVTGHTIDRFLPVLGKYYDSGASAFADVGSMFMSHSVGFINETGDYLDFTFPTCFNHRKVVYAALIYGGQGNQGSQTFTVNGTIYRASNAQGYTTDSATFSFGIPGVSNGKMYQRNITSVFPTLQQGHNNSLRLTFTEDNNGSTLGVFGIQLVEATNPI